MMVWLSIVPFFTKIACSDIVVRTIVGAYSSWADLSITKRNPTGVQWDTIRIKTNTKSSQSHRRGLMHEGHSRNRRPSRRLMRTRSKYT